MKMDIALSARCERVAICDCALRVTIASAASIVFLCGCATAERRYTAGQLPTELQAVRWQAPCTVDLSPGVAERVVPKFDVGDEVEVQVATGLRFSEITRVKTTVARDGTIELPVLGRISVTGGMPEVKTSAIVQASHEEDVSPARVVQISMQQPRQHHITVSGAVEHPGIYVLPRQSSDLVSALAAAGGLSRDAGEKIAIQSRRTVPGQTSGGDELRATNRGDRKAAAPPATRSERPANDRRVINVLTASAAELAREELKDGDIVTVEHHDRPGVVVTGLVQQPGRYAMPIGEEFRVLDAIANAHGPSYKIVDTVLICRAVPGKAVRAVIEVSLREAARNQKENLLLMPGDILTVESDPRVLAQDAVSYVAFALLGIAPAVGY